ncbi:MAG TPA: GNAT family N-acetyltransferase [Anaerolineae bacterium]|nr:GNAT family N-acetyltransferase [Anaerolineae bacterium]
MITTLRGDIAIRPAAGSDVAAYRALRLEALRLHPEAFGADYASNLAEPLEYWVTRLQQNTGDDGMIYFAEAGGGLVGMTGLRRGYAPKGQHNGLIWGVYVRPEWRGLKIAEALLGACVDWARARGVRLVKLAVVTTNTAAIRCYTRCGFTVYGIEPEVLYYDGVYYDELLMARRILETDRSDTEY